MLYMMYHCIIAIILYIRHIALYDHNIIAILLCHVTIYPYIIVRFARHLFRDADQQDAQAALQKELI